MVTWTLVYKLSNVIAQIEETVFVKPKKSEVPLKQTITWLLMHIYD